MSYFMLCSLQSASLELHAPKLTETQMEKDDNAIYSTLTVPDLPIKYRSQKGSRKEIRLRTVRRWGRESTSETWHKKKGLSAWAVSLCLLILIPCCSMADIETGYWIDRETVKILLPEQQSIRNRVGQETQTSTEPAELLQTGAEVSSLPELQQTAAGKPSALTRRETLACISSIYF